MDTTGGWIAVVAQWRHGHAKIPTAYVHAVELAGGRARVLSTFHRAGDDDAPIPAGSRFGLDVDDGSCLAGASGLLIPGGGDIDPALYGEPRHPRTHRVSTQRDRFELTLLDAALDHDMPVLAICHGMQLLNVHLGGTLDQHLADDPDHLDHDRDRPRAEPAHHVRVKSGSPLESILGKHAAVNSHHHQGLGRVSSELEEIAWAEDDVLEAVVMPSRSWVLGVQWHPEAMAPVDHKELDIFRTFVDTTNAYAAEAPAEARSA